MARHRSRSAYSSGSSAGIAGRLVVVLLVLVLVVLIGGAVTLGFWEIEPPTQPVEKPVAHERSSG